MKTIVQHGLGYVGVTGAMHLCQAGIKVIGYDPDLSTVNGINNGNPRTGEYLGYIDDSVKSFVSSGLLSATNDFDSIKTYPIHFLSVPTEKDGEPYLDIVKKCISTLAEVIPNQGLIVVESTLQPGTIDDILPTIKRAIGKDIYIAVAFRTDWFGDKEKNLTNLPRFVGGVTDKCTDRATEIISQICTDTRRTNYRIAEIGKPLQNALYFVQIASVYKMAYEYPHVDSNEVLQVVSSHWRLPDLYLGFGTSGRCIAAGAKYMINGSESEENNILSAAVDWDKRMRTIVADIVANKLMTEDKALVLGMAYRPNFTDMGYSAGLDVAKALHNRGIDTYINDPVVKPELIQKLNFKTGSITKDIDAILLATGHDNYLSLPEEDHLWRQGQIIVDGPGVWEKYRDLFKNKGIHYLRIGQADWLGGKIPPKRNLRKAIFDNIDSSEKAYWLGYLYADGCVDIRQGESYTLRLTSKDRDIIDKFCRFIGCGHVTLIPRWMNYVYQISSKELVTSLSKYGIIPRKTYSQEPVFIPEDNLQNHFWRGVFDGDGSLFSIVVRNKRIIGLNVSGLNIQFLQNCLDYFGRGSIQKVTKKADGFKWVYQGPSKYTIPMLDKIYDGADECIRMDRKYQRYIEYKSNIFKNYKDDTPGYFNNKTFQKYGWVDLDKFMV